jgi:serine protease Do
MRSLFKTALLATGLGVTILAVVALVVTFAPFVQAQVASGDRPLAELRTQVLGGSEIGVEVRDLDQTDVKREKLASASGAIVENVYSDGPAAKAGMKAGDVILSFDGEPIRSARQLSRLIDETPDGREISTVVMRAGQKVTMKVTPVAAAAWADSDILRELRSIHLPERLNLDLAPLTLRHDGLSVLSLGRGRLGVGVQDLTDQLSEYFGVTDGVLVTQVDNGTPAQAAGLKAGDVITKVGTRAVRSTTDLRQALTGVDGETTIAIVRDKKAQTLTVTIDDGLVVRRRIVR